MRKYIIIYIMLACLPMAARGQTITDLADIDLSGLPQPTSAKALRYWFDDDAASVQTTNQLSGNQLLDVSGLIEGLHTLHYQVIDTEDGVAYVGSGLFLKVAHSTSLSVKSMRYWFDDDAASVQTAGGTTGTYTLDVANLIEGLHTLHYQLIDESGLTAYVGSSIFLKINSHTGGQVSVNSLRYWFDDDQAGVKTLASAGTHTLDVSDLLDGLHTIHYQVKGSDGHVHYIASALFLKAGNSFGSETVKAQKLLFWFDDETTMQHADISEGTQVLDASGLIEGLHTLHYQVLCNNGQMTPSMSTLFLRVNADAETAVAKNLRYWFDDEQTATEVEITEGVQQLDASGLIEGLHTVHYQIANSNGTLGAPYSSIFLMMNWDTATSTAKSLRYWFDDETTVSETAVANGAQTLDAAKLIDGLHTVHYQIVDSNGTLGAPASSVFLKMDASAYTTAQSLRYWFDDNAATVATTSVAGGTQTLDVSALPTGLHTLNYQLIDSQGRVTAPVTRLFMKNFDKVLADGHNRVTKYQYWLNMNSQAMQTVELNAVSNPYTLIALLPMQKEPIQSSQFHFEVTNGVPTIYAKNTLHVRFYDAQNYFSDGDKPFIDYSVKQDVEPVGELFSTQTFDKVANNDIRWYTVNVEAGDTLAFKTNQATTLQLFAPSGEELYKAEGSSSVNFGGCHTWETGTHYLAVHDVTGTQNDLTLDYMHMDKYDVVDWDVHKVGNGGCSTITFKGNGFRDLYAVDLYTVEGDTIHSVDVSHDSDAETAVTFDFMGATLDEYNAMFHFTEEDKNIAKAITVEEATDINLVTDVSFPSTFLRGTSTTYTIKITNLGNMTAYQVPLDIQIATNSQSAITNIRFSDNIPPVNVDWMDTLTITKEEIDLVREFIKEKGDLLHFTTSYDSLNNKYVKVCLMALRISPNTTTTITLNIASVERVDVRVKTTDVMNPVYTYNIYEIKRQYLKRRASFTETMCCYREKVECVMNVIVSLADFASIFAGPQGKLATCIADLGNTVLQFSYDVWCGEEHGGKDFGKAADDLVWDAVNGLVGCATNIPGLKKLGTLDWIYQHIYNNIKTTMDCVSSLSQKIPNCPPCTTCGGGGGSTPQPPVDPNDIYGYLSESGSKFIADSVARVNYTIEFENDTTFATAAAHTIVIKDTLDSRYFDLNTFVPTGVRIGRKKVQLSEADVQSSKGVTSFVKTVDMRPEIYAIAQVEGEYIHKTGIATWTFQSLDPMTMEPTDELMQGILPVNYDGTSGIGEVMFEVGMKSGKADGTEIPNRAGIVFDYEQPIITPTWTNIVDATAPTSLVAGGVQTNDTTLVLKLYGEDNLSGVWKYDVYAQMGEGTPWELVAANVADSVCEVRIYEGIEYAFCAMATDSAGNVERKTFASEYAMTTVTLGDANSDGTVDALDVVLATSYYLGNNVYLNFAATDVVADGEINSLDVVAIQNIYLNTTNGGKALAPRRRRVRNK